MKKSAAQLKRELKEANKKIAELTKLKDERESRESVRDAERLVLSTLDTAVAERKKTEEALEKTRFALEHQLRESAAELFESEMKFRAVVDQLRFGIFIGTAKGKTILFNKASEEIFGYSSEEVNKHGIFNLTMPNPQQKKMILEIAARAIDEEIPYTEMEFIRKDKRKIWAGFSLKPFEINGKKYVLGTTSDITERKQNQEALRQSEEKYRTLAEAANDVIYIIGKNLKYEYMNEQGARQFGYESKSMVGKSLKEVFGSEEMKRRLKLLNDVFKSGKAKYIEEQIVLPNTAIWSGTWLSPIKNKDGKTLSILGVSRDITERKEIEEALRKNERLLIEAQKLGKIGNWEFDLVSQETSWSDETYELYERDKSMGPPAAEEEARYYTPEDSERLQKYGRLAIEQGQSFKFDVTANLPSGKTAFFSATMSPGKDAKGRVVRLFGTVQDITERHRAEEEQLKSEIKYRRIVDTASEGIWMLGPDTLTTYVNARMADMLGYSSEEIIGRPGTDFMFEEDAVDHLKRMENRRRKISETYERRFRRKDGQELWTLASATPIIDDEHNFNGALGMFTDITERKQATDKLRHLAYYDSLTDIPNITFFDDLLEKEIKKAELENKKVAVCFLDLDNFKTVKNTLGYNFAENLLIKIAGYLRSAVPGGLVGKVGEDEYSLAFSVKREADAVILAQHILNIFNEPWSVESQNISVTANLGIAFFPEDGTNINDLETNADSAMAHAKKEGFNNYVLFEKNMAASSEIARDRLLLASSLNSAIKNAELFVYYQPIIDAKIGEIIGMEALVRWQKPGGELILPAEFIPLAEDTGQIVLIGDFVFESVCRHIEKWRNSGFFHFKLAINLSAKQFLQKDLAEELSKKPANIRNSITIELTESDIMKNPELAIRTMNQLKDWGYTISIDDFGTGYASLSYLKQFPVDFIKIDKSFIDRIVISRKDQAIVAAAIDMAHGLDIIVIGEGVETPQQYAFLRKLGCDEAQGYLFAKPMPPDEFEELLSKENRWAA